MRAIVAVLDSFGVGASADAERFGDAGADTFGHIVHACIDGAGDREGLRAGPLLIPNLLRLGLGRVAEAARGTRLPLEEPERIEAAYAYAQEISRGKDTPSGHWEMMGLPVEFDWGYFPAGPPSFPAALTDALVRRADLPGVLGNCHESGTVILERLGAEHIASGKPIVYTSADSVFQIAAHEEHFGLQRLYEVCAIARDIVDEYNVGRVIARPFTGERAGEFHRTRNRRDIATPPHAPTLLDVHADAGGEVRAIGKISDIFARSGISHTIKAGDNGSVFDTLLAQLAEAPDGAIVFANFVDFDMLFGHRRDVPGYAAALEAFDRRLPELERALKPGDVAVLTADHGCDPTWPGTDHTREYIPMLAFGPRVATGDRGRRASFADLGQTLAAHLGHAPLPHGKAFAL